MKLKNNSRCNLRAFRAAAFGLIGFINLLYAAPAIAQSLFVVEHSFKADLVIHEVKYASQADILVYKVKYPYRAKGNIGHWYFTDNVFLASKSIFFTKYSYRADINVYYVKYPNQSKWITQEKKKLFEY